MKTLLLCSSVVFLFASEPLPAQTTFKSLSPLATFGPRGDGAIIPGDQFYVTTTSFQRGLSYNPVTGNLIFIDREAGGGGTNVITGAIYVLSGTDGSFIRTLSTNGMEGGSFADLAVGVADDGVVYVGNLVTVSGINTPFKLYRWESDSTTNDSVLVLNENPGGAAATSLRWGDTMDIRGAGTNTQIILGSRNAGATVGTNVALLTTIDGTNYTSIILRTDVADSASGGGIAFGTGNTFWTKNLDVPLRQFSFDLAAGTATTLRSYPTNVLAVSRNLEPMAVDATNNLLAIVEMTSGLDRIRLYDISNPANPPVLLDLENFGVNNANGTTTKGYLDFGGGKLYVHNMNNGLMAFTVDSTAITPPVISAQIVSQRLITGRTLNLEALAYPSATYQWQRNGVNLPGATNAFLTLTNIQPTNAGTYRLIASNSSGSTTSDEAVITVVNPADLFHLEPLWNATPGVGAYVTSTGGSGTPNERSFAYNALSNHLYVVQRSGNNYTIHVIDAATGVKLYNLKTNGILPVIVSESAPNANGIGLVAIDVADDGAIYACNSSPNAGGGQTFATNKLFRVYRWANGDSNTEPIQIFEGDPAGQPTNLRWGDALDARGSGTNTQILLDNQNASARFIAILRPTDEAMTNFFSSFFFQDTSTPFGTSIGRTLEYGTGNTVWQKRKAAALIQSSFDLSGVLPGISPVLNIYPNFPAGIGVVGLSSSQPLAAGINILTVTTAPDTLDLFDVTDLSNPLLLAQYNFPINHVANANSIGRVLFAGNNVFALNGNNGLLAFRVVSGPISPPGILQQPQDLNLATGGRGTLSVTTADITTFQWQFNGTNIFDATNSTYTITNALLSDAGTYRVIVSNDAGSTPSSNAVVTVRPAEDFHRLTQIWSVAPLSRAYLPTDTDAQGRTPLYRSIAYNALSNQVYVISRTSQLGGLTVNVLDASTGADLYQLNTSTIDGGTIILLAMGVAEDGALYAVNMVDANSALTYNLYRWANSDPNTTPVLVYSGDPGAVLAPLLRWGDAMTVRGAGTNTEILVDANNGAHAALLRPVDASMNLFNATPFSQSYGSGTIGRSLEFGTSNTFWQKRKGAALLLSSYDLTNQTSAALTNHGNFPSSLGPVALDLSRNLLVGIDFSSTTALPDTVDLYDISNLNNPLLLAKYNFPENSRPNGNFIGQILVASNRVYAVDGNNGIAAFDIVPPGGIIPAPFLSIARENNAVVLSWPVSFAGFILQETAALVPPNWQTNSAALVTFNGTHYMTNTPTGTSRFFRLRR